MLLLLLLQGNHVSLRLSNDIRNNCVSVSQSCDLGYKIIFTADTVRLERDSGVVCGTRDGGPYQLSVSDVVSIGTWGESKARYGYVGRHDNISH